MRLIFNQLVTFLSPLEQFEINSVNTPLNYIVDYNFSYPINLIEAEYFTYFLSKINYSIFDCLFILGLIFLLQTFFKQKGYLFLFILIQILLVGFNLISFTETIFETGLDLNLIGSLEVDLYNKNSLNDLVKSYLARIDYLYSIALEDIDPRIVRKFEILYEERVSINDLGRFSKVQPFLDENTYFDSFAKYLELEQRLYNACNEREIGLVYLNTVIKEHLSNGVSFIPTISETVYLYTTTITSFTNIYSVSFCFIFIYFVIYLIYNKMLSNNTNTLIPTLYQILAENLYKLSLNLFYSILGKHISIPEFFIKINTIFIFLIISNVQGMIPYMSTLTSALTNTFFIALALFLSILTTLLDKKGLNYFLNLFMPSGCPILLSLLIIPIELISYSFRLVSLSVRLFANMMAGHTLLKVIVGFS